jgi:hypothetical protein
VSCVYLGDGWVLTAQHVGAGDAYFNDVHYPWLPGSAFPLHNPPPEGGPADLVMFLIYPPYPPAPDLSIASAAPAVGTSLVMIGNGRNRGAATTWNPPGPGSYDGYLWGPGGAKRWGSNKVEVASSFASQFDMHVFGTEFHQSGSGHTTYEAQAANGDSGGAVFALNGPSYELAGIMIAVTGYVGQPAETSLFGNETFSADLSAYRDEIEATMLPEPAGGLVAGVAFLAWLTRAGTRRACRGTASAASSPRRE